MLIQAVIGAKEAITEAIIGIINSDITKAILQISDGIDFKGINKYQVFKIIDATII